jgi:septal ring factor EnvC (AmiA/AmiB activator)
LARGPAWFALVALGACLVLLVTIPLARADSGAAPAAANYWPLWASAGVNLAFTLVGSMVMEIQRRSANEAREAVQRLSVQFEKLDARLAETREQHSQRLADVRQESVPRSELRTELTELRDGQRQSDRKLATVAANVDRLLHLMAPGGARG